MKRYWQLIKQLVANLKSLKFAQSNRIYRCAFSDQNMQMQIVLEKMLKEAIKYCSCYLQAMGNSAIKIDKINHQD